MKPTVQPALFDEQQTPTGNCPMCCRPDGSPNGKWPRPALSSQASPVDEQCPNCGGSRTAEVPF